MEYEFDEYGRPKKDKWYDNLFIGLLVGFFLPVFVLYVIISKQFPDASVSDTLALIWKMTTQPGFSLFFITSILPNMFIFMVFYKKEWWKTCRGALVATLLLFAVYAFRGFVD